MIAQWENEYISLSVLPVAWVRFPTMAGYFKGFFLADHILATCPELTCMAENGSISSQWHHKPMETEEEGRSRTKDRECLR